MAKDTRPRTPRPQPPAAAVDSAAALRQEIAQLSKKEFLARLDQATRAFSADEGNPGSFHCTDCVRCTNCMFCRKCEHCYGCTHCTRCVQCNNCSHCHECTHCHNCAYCVKSDHCTGSAYVVLSRYLSECTYCFGCVGLSKRDFHILNVPFSRGEYFKTVSRLKKELGLTDKR